MRSNAITYLLFLVVLVVAQYVAAQDNLEASPTTITVTVVYASQATPTSTSTTPSLPPTTSSTPTSTSSSSLSSIPVSIATLPSAFASTSGIASSTPIRGPSSLSTMSSSSVSRTGTAATPTLTSLVQGSGAGTTKINVSMAMVLGSVAALVVGVL